VEDFTRKVSGQDQTDVIRHGLGARGIDFIETDAYNASPSGAYPLYDGHGNMIATLTKQPTNSFSLSARRYTDPWGVTRVGASTGKPDQRYCANLGHRQDDESGLTYMRARYYEPTTGRFISEDPARDGLNWHSFGSNTPTSLADADGRMSIYAQVFLMALIFGTTQALTEAATKSAILGGTGMQYNAAQDIVDGMIETIVVAYVINLYMTEFSKPYGRMTFNGKLGLNVVTGAIAGIGVGLLLAITAGLWQSGILAELLYLEHCT